jgi:hypothetical protein
VQSAFQNVQEYLLSLPDDTKLLKKAPAQFVVEYNPGIDESLELNPVMENFFQSQI